MSTSVLGLGNVLMGDDAVGPYVIQVLEAGYSFPETVRVLELGTPGLDLVPYLCGVDAVIVVDTLVSDASPGTVRLYRRDELLEHAPQPRLSPHDPSLKEALLTAEFSGEAPGEFLLVGVVPQGTAVGTGLSEAARVALEPAVAAVVSELQRLGHQVDRRSEPLEMDIWWERQS